MVSKKLPLSILTDFEELSVYDCRIQPTKTDKAATARLLYFTYPDYTQRWEDIATIFSREAILAGSFDAYAESMKRKKGTLEVDTAFLKEIESWRVLLARHMALRNPQLTQDLANGKTVHEQMTLQRQIHAADRQIDQLIYQLYGLTAEEINIVEQATQ